MPWRPAYECYAGVGWFVALVVLNDRNGAGDYVDGSLILSSSGQTTVAVVAVIGAAIVATRQSCFDLMFVNGERR